MKRLRFIFLVMIGLWLLFVGRVNAQIKISEVYPQPLAGENEWVELINVASSSVDLTGWVIEDVLSTPKTIFTFQQQILFPGELMIASFSGQLNNTADGVTLKNASGETVSQMNYQSSAIGLSWSLDDSGTYQQASPSYEVANSIAPIPTPSMTPSPAPTISPIPTPFPSPSPTNNVDPEILKQLQLTRASICPKTGPEWLEWFNPTTAEIAVDLSIFDLQDNNLIFEVHVPNQQKIITNLARNIFNNNGDQVAVYYGDQLLLKKTFAGCEVLGSLWSDGVVLDSGSSSSSTAVQNETVTAPSPIPVFVFPSSVIADLQTKPVPNQVHEVATVSGLVLGETTHWQDRSIWPAVLVICGGFFWLGLSIIEVYGQPSRNAQALG